jgi:hypothetical protein
MGAELLAIGGVTSVIAIGAFGGAVRETLLLVHLRKLFNDVVEEPVPDSIMVVFNSLGDEQNGDRA